MTTLAINLKSNSPVVNPYQEDVELGNYISVTNGRLCTTHKLECFESYTSEKRAIMTEGWAVEFANFYNMKTVLLMDGEGNCSVVRLYPRSFDK